MLFFLQQLTDRKQPQAFHGFKSQNDYGDENTGNGQNFNYYVILSLCWKRKIEQIYANVEEKAKDCPERLQENMPIMSH